MIKVSRPILYVALAGAVVYTAVVLMGPETPPKKAAKRLTKAAVKTQDGFLPEDMRAQFARYSGRMQNAFLPGIVPSHSAMAQTLPGGLPSGFAALGQWTLTGITVINGTRLATLENKSTLDIQSVQAGDQWNGFRITAVGPEAITLVNAQKQITRLTFPLPEEERAPATPATPPTGLRVMPILPPLANSRDAQAAPSLSSRERSVNER